MYQYFHAIMKFKIRLTFLFFSFILLQGGACPRQYDNIPIVENDLKPDQDSPKDTATVDVFTAPDVQPRVEDRAVPLPHDDEDEEDGWTPPFSLWTQFLDLATNVADALWERALQEATFRLSRAVLRTLVHHILAPNIHHDGAIAIPQAHGQLEQYDGAQGEFTLSRLLSIVCRFTVRDDSSNDYDDDDDNSEWPLEATGPTRPASVGGLNFNLLRREGAEPPIDSTRSDYVPADTLRSPGCDWPDVQERTLFTQRGTSPRTEYNVPNRIEHTLEEYEDFLSPGPSAARATLTLRPEVAAVKRHVDLIMRELHVHERIVLIRELNNNLIQNGIPYGIRGTALVRKKGQRQFDIEAALEPLRRILSPRGGSTSPRSGHTSPRSGFTTPRGKR
jgi:hypothetical protein